MRTIWSSYINFAMLLFMPWSQTYGQDTLQIVEQLRSKNDFQGAINLLNSYCKSELANSIALQMLAETYYWSGQYDAASSQYQQIILEFENMDSLYLTLAKVYMADQQLLEAEKSLEKFFESEYLSAEAYYLMAVLNYWDGQFAVSKINLSRALELSPGYHDARSLRLYIDQLLAHKFEIKNQYSNDSQPYGFNTTELSYDKYVSDLLQPGLDVKADFYRLRSDKEFIPSVNIRNRSNLRNLSSSIKAGIGLIRYPQTGTETVWEVSLNKKIIRETAINFSYSKYVYQNTPASIDFPVFYKRRKLEVENGESKGSTKFKLGYMGDNLDDGNFIHNYYAWFIRSIFSSDLIELYLGYSFRYANSRANSFMAVQSLEDVIEGFDPERMIEGRHFPYFTPENEINNLAILKSNITPSAEISFEVSLAYGFLSTADNPYIFLEGDAVDPSFALGFSNESFTPLAINAGFEWEMVDNIKFVLNYSRNEMLFYEQDLIKLGLKLELYERK